MIQSLTIANFKSILRETIELSNVNVFIGENGCGKTNVLEAVAIQRLFVVKRTDNGDTKTEQIMFKPTAQNKEFKLSELWMRGYLGGLPHTF